MYVCMCVKRSTRLLACWALWFTLLRNNFPTYRKVKIKVEFEKKRIDKTTPACRCKNGDLLFLQIVFALLLLHFFNFARVFRASRSWKRNRAWSVTHRKWIRERHWFQSSHFWMEQRDCKWKRRWVHQKRWVLTNLIPMTSSNLQSVDITL